MQVATGATATIPVGYGPGAIIFDGNYLWIANANDNTVAKMLPNGTAVAYETVGNGPSSLTFDGSSIWVTNEQDGTVTQIRAVN